MAPLKTELIKLSWYPVNLTSRLPGWLSAKSALVIDLDSRSILFSKNPDLQLMPASTTKIMTALVVLEDYSLDRMISVENPVFLGQVMKLEEGERITVKNLLYGLLIQSANDAAEVLASNFPGGRQAFIKKMNEKTKEFYLKDTTFVNPTGVEEYGHYSTVHDLSLLATVALENPLFQEIVSTKEIIVTDVTGKIEHKLENVNKLLGKVGGIKGVKTGWTESAGECLISFVERENHGIITVVLGSQDRFGETSHLIEWAFANHRWEATGTNQQQ